MAHDDARVVSYLAGDLESAEAEAFERHLVDCDHCWRAVSADRRGRALAETLRELAPASLRDRVRMHVEADTPTKSRSRRRRGLAAAFVAIAVVLVTAGALATLGGGTAADPVAAVVRAAADPPVSGSVVVDGRKVELTRDVLDGRVVTVGRSDASFPMPAGGRYLGNEAGAPWVATRGSMTIVCLSSPENLLVVAHLPAERLVSWARQLPPAPGPR